MFYTFAPLCFIPRIIMFYTSHRIAFYTSHQYRFIHSLVMQLRTQHIKLRRKSRNVMTSSLLHTSYVVSVKRATEQKTFKLFYPITLQRIRMQQHMTRTALSFVLESAFTLKESFAFVFVPCTCSYICSSVLSYVCSCICNTLLL